MKNGSASPRFGRRYSMRKGELWLLVTKGCSVGALGICPNVPREHCGASLTSPGDTVNVPRDHWKCPPADSRGKAVISPVLIFGSWEPTNTRLRTLCPPSKSRSKSTRRKLQGQRKGLRPQLRVLRANEFLKARAQRPVFSGCRPGKGAEEDHDA